MKRPLKLLTSFPIVLAATTLLILLLTFIPNISNLKILTWANYASLNKVEAIEKSYEYISVFNNRAEVHPSLAHQEGFSVGIRIAPVMRAIAKWLESLGEKPGFIRAFFPLLLLIINIIIGLIIFIFNILLGFFNIISFVFLPIWLYLVNLMRSRWDKVNMDIHLGIPIEEEAKAKFFLRKKPSSTKIIFKNYKGFLDKIPVQIYKEEACVVRINLNCKPQNSADKNPNKLQLDSSFLDKLLNAFQPVVNESYLNENIQLDKKTNYSLELDLSSPEFKILPSEKQSQPLDLEELSYRWNCKVNNTGEHKLDLVFRVVEQYDSSKIQKIMEIERDVRVVQIFGLTKDQAENLAKGVAALVVTYGFINGVIRGLHAIF